MLSRLLGINQVKPPSLSTLKNKAGKLWYWTWRTGRRNVDPLSRLNLYSATLGYETRTSIRAPFPMAAKLHHVRTWLKGHPKATPHAGAHPLGDKVRSRSVENLDTLRRWHLRRWIAPCGNQVAEDTGRSSSRRRRTWYGRFARWRAGTRRCGRLHPRRVAGSRYRRQQEHRRDEL